MRTQNTVQLQPGSEYPLGAQWDGKGINFAIVAPSARSVVLCLFDEHGEKEIARLSMPKNENGIWSGYLPNAPVGTIYGYRVFGPYNPQNGQRFNSNKVLLDPYAREIVGTYGGQEEFRDDCPADTAAIALKGKVVHEVYDWGDDKHPRVPLADMMIYEMHIKGFTQLHAEVPEEIRGTYAGMAHPVVLDYLEKLGITTVCVLPVHARADEARLIQMGLSNYWGYTSIGFFAPENRYWSGRSGTTPISEFRDMVKGLHSRGIEVVLDVVYNHTAEGGNDGAMLSFRGIDNALYYHLSRAHLDRYENWSGCGNSLNLGSPQVLRMVMDSLRYWVEEMHVDGFRYDMAPILGREVSAFSPTSGFFSVIMQDPVLSQVKQIAEPWDLGPNGYQLGNFPLGWMEWNDKYRDTMRSFWLHQWPTLGEFAKRFTASSDIFRPQRRMPSASINFLTVHDGFTLQDLVSYNHKHNEANGEENRDGHNYNHSWNCGVEGDATGQAVNKLRFRLKRAMLATLLFSQGTPMLLAGDELGHSQQGNNNTYCQDNELTWINWEKADPKLMEYVHQLIQLRKHYPGLRHKKWFDGEEMVSGNATLNWLSHMGGEVKGDDWNNKSSFCIGMLIRTDEMHKDCMILLNASAQEIIFRLPAGGWQIELDSSDHLKSGTKIEFQILLPAHSLLLAIPS